MSNFLVFLESITWSISQISPASQKPKLVDLKQIKLSHNWVSNIRIVWRPSVLQGVSGLVGKTRLKWGSFITMLNLSLLRFGPSPPLIRFQLFSFMVALTVRIIKTFRRVREIIFQRITLRGRLQRISMLSCQPVKKQVGFRQERDTLTLESSWIRLIWLTWDLEGLLSLGTRVISLSGWIGPWAMRLRLKTSQIA